MQYHFKVHREKEGYWAQGIELPSCLTEADSWEELLDNLDEALYLYLNDPKGKHPLPPLPDEKIKTRGKSTIAVKVQPKAAFAVLMRYERKKQGFTQEKAQAIMGYNRIYSYQRLEKPTDIGLSTLQRVLSAFPDFPIQKVFS